MDSIELTYQEFITLPSENYFLVDLRDSSSAAYGMLPHAINIPVDEISKKTEMLPKDKLIILYCTKGTYSLKKAEELTKKGFSVVSLSGGYQGWLMQEMLRSKESDENRQKTAADIELSIRKKFHKELFSKFAKAVKNYELIQNGDKIAVCISGGKDSMLMAKLFQELQRHRQTSFELVFLVMDPGYNELNRTVIEDNARRLNLPITIFESKIFDAVYQIEKSPCYLCARMRRGYLYNKAKELGCNKIALGHHYDDVIETILMGMLYGAQMQSMMPKLHSTNFEGMELIRPMYLIRESDIIRWRDYNQLRFIQCACHFTDNCTTCHPDGSSTSKRMEIKHLISDMKKINPFVESNIFKSAENVNVDTLIAYKKDGKRHSFLEDYDLRK